MPTIDIRRRHRLPLARARAVVDEIARDFVHKFELETRWQKDRLEFRRHGVEGVIELSKDQIRVYAELSWLLLPIKSLIEQEVERHLQQSFG